MYWYVLLFKRFKENQKRNVIIEIPRTTATGYKSAKIFSNGQVIDGIGGGICQISSTLYNAALYANLEITERRNHQFVPSYLKAGLDATVVYASQDFKFKNSRKYPIKIVSEVNGGIAKINIFGLREDIEYDIKIQSVVVQSNANAVKSVTYKYRYLNGNKVDKVVISRDTYKRWWKKKSRLLYQSSLLTGN